MKRSSIIIAFLSTIVQFYDYALFGLSAAALTKAYMPSSTESSQFLGFFAALSAATLMRPVGSLIFGRLGDSKGRAIVLKAACLLAALSTIFIALIPGEATIFSASCMVICRMAFMMSMPGEGDGVRIYVAESIGAKREYLGNGLVTCCSQIGALLAAISWWVASHELLPEYWWRVNFILGGVAGLIIFAMRSKLQESAEFLAKPTGALIKPQLQTFLLATIISGCIGGIYHFQIIFFGTYMSKMVGILSAEYVAKMSIIAVFLYVIISPLSGYLADKFNPLGQSLVSIIFIILLSLLGAYSVSADKFNIWWFLGICGLMPLYSVPLQILLKRRMPISSRLQVFSLSHSIGSMIFSSSVPFICSRLWYATGFVWLPMIYMAVMGVMLLSCVVVAFGKDA